MYDSKCIQFTTITISQLGINALTVTSLPEINITLGSDSTIVLNCTFEKEVNEKVVFITWSKKNEKTEDQYTPLVKYYFKAVVYNDCDLENRSNSITFDDNSNSAILNISEVQCRDNGNYRCDIEYVAPSGKHISIITAVNIQGKKVPFH